VVGAAHVELYCWWAI